MATLEYACARADKLPPKPVNLTFEAAAVVAASGCTAIQALRDLDGPARAEDCKKEEFNRSGPRYDLILERLAEKVPPSNALTSVFACLASRAANCRWQGRDIRPLYCLLGLPRRTGAG